MNSQINYSYYVYLGAIARIHKQTKQLQVHDRTSGLWEIIQDPIVWERILREGDLVSEKEAHRLFQIFRSK